MKTILVLAMHGAPPNDFPRDELAEYMSLHNQLEHIPGSQQGTSRKRYVELQDKLWYWPRTPLNDPFFAGSRALAKKLEEACGLPVVLGFNEFCAPNLDEAIEHATMSADRVLVITPMMTRGGEYSEHDIPESIQRVQSHHPDVLIQYIWPFDTREVARFLAEQVKRSGRKGRANSIVARPKT
jgi:sirohydrochlorin cobaltochelatase